VGVVKIFKDQSPLSLSRKKCMFFNPEIVISFITFFVSLTDVQEFLLRIRDALGLMSSCDRKIRESHQCW
jgi:hypothetical protein